MTTPAKRLRVDVGWMSSFNEILHDERNGLQCCDLPDDEQDYIIECAEMGLTPDEVFDVFTEVEDVE